MGSKALPPPPPPLSREIRAGSHEWGEKRVYFCLIIKNFYNMISELKSNLVHEKVKALSPPRAYLCFLGASQAQSQVYGTHAIPILGLILVQVQAASAAPTSSPVPALWTGKGSPVQAVPINTEIPSLLAV